MFRALDAMLEKFRNCFSREASFGWFAIIVVGFIVRFDHQGVSSFVRWLFLNPPCYELILHSFRASSWDLDVLIARWTLIALNNYPVIEFNGRKVLIGDGIKVSKEAQKMPGVKSLHQDSENSGKAEFIRGHHFQFVGLLVGSFRKTFCLLLHGQIHEGIDELRPAQGVNGKPPTIVTRMAHLVVNKTKQTGYKCYVALDAYFSVSPAFQILKQSVTESGEQWIHLITRAKDNYVAYLYHEPQKKFEDKKKVHLWDIFDFPSVFKETEVRVYGQTRTVLYFCEDFLWRPLNDLIRFVLVLDGDNRYILMCSDLDLPAPEIITIYSYRSKIEVSFLMLKHLMGAFAYRFWTKAFPKLARGVKLDYSTLNQQEKEKFLSTLEAIERFVNLGAIALGLLQYLSLTKASQIWDSYQGWLRTSSSELPSEAVVQNVLQAEFFSSIGKVRVCRTLQRIKEKRRETGFEL